MPKDPKRDKLKFRNKRANKGRKPNRGKRRGRNMN